jgi:hypothetical protein
MRPPSPICDDEDANGPKVGIFWLVAGRLIADSTPLNRAEEYGSCKTQSRSHEERWEQLTRAGVLVEGDYEGHPRGRIVYDTRTDQFTIYADKCIIKKKVVIRKIMREMNLPANAKISTDPHYRCFVCLENEPEE